MNRLLLIFAFLPGGWCLSGAPAAGQFLSIREAPFERIKLDNGRVYRGFIESDDGAWINLIQIVRRGGKPMYLVIRPFERESVAEVVRLDPARRARLKDLVEQFRNRSRIEAGRMEAVDLELVSREGRRRRHYRGEWFTLESTADEETTRRLIVRTEQIFTAYRQILPPRTKPPQPPRLVIIGSMEEYRAHLKRLGIEIENRACFVLDKNLVLAGSEVARFGAQLAENRAYHQKLLEELAELQKQTATRLAELGRELKEQGLPRKDVSRLIRKEQIKIARMLEEKRTQIARCDHQNGRMFDDVTRQMFVRLYHEAFHAYLESYVYPHGRCDVPLWLNEGLAMVCEGGQLESDTLRIDAPNAVALKRLKADLNGEEPLGLEQILSAGQRQFSAHGDAGRYYVYAWGLAHWLTFHNSLPDRSALDRYVRRGDGLGGPVERFEELVDMPLAQFERGWRRYVGGLR